MSKAQRFLEAVGVMTGSGMEGGFYKFLGDVTGKLTPMGKLALQNVGQDQIKAAYAAAEQDPESRGRYLSSIVRRLETRAQKHESVVIGRENDSEPTSLRANHRSGVRCLQCGRMLSKIHSLPSIRTCPNAECSTRYQVIRLNRGLGIRAL